MGGCWSSRLARVLTRPSWWSSLQRRGCITSRDLSGLRRLRKWRKRFCSCAHEYAKLRTSVAHLGQSSRMRSGNPKSSLGLESICTRA